MGHRRIGDRRRDVGGIEAVVVALYDEHADALRGWLFSRTASSDVAADLCAECFAVAIERFDTYDPTRAAAGAWLWGIARNLLRDYQRSAAIDDRARRRLAMRTPLVHHDTDTTDRLDAELTAAVLHAALDTLSDPLARAVRLRVVDGLAFSEVAAACGCSEAAARTRVSRALSALLDQLGDALDPRVVR